MWHHPRSAQYERRGKKQILISLSTTWRRRGYSLARMARPLRVQYPGAVYHVMARGNQGKPVYGDDSDRKVWLETLAEACGKTGWRIHAYVLMGNHYHLLVETPEANLNHGAVGLSWIAGRLEMGHESRVSQAVLRMRRRPGRRLKRCQRLLNEMGRNERSK